MYLSKIPTKPLGMLTHLLTLANPAWVHRPSSYSLLLIALFSGLVCSLPWSLQFPSLDCLLFSSGTFLPLSSGLVGNLTRKPFMWVSHQNRQRDPLTGTHTHTQRNKCHPSHHNGHSLVYFVLVLWHINQCWSFNAKSFL